MSIADDIVDGELCPLCAGPGEVCDCAPEAIKSAGGHLFVALRANARRAKEQDQREVLVRMGAEVQCRNDGHHWLVVRQGKRWDYWPSRQKFRGPGEQYIRRGFDKMVGEMRRVSP